METANVQAFRGIRYNREKVRDLDAAVAPPYDVISPDQKEGFLARHPDNVVRLILPDEAEGRDKYSRAGHLLREWLDGGILLQDDEPSMYVCAQEYEVGGDTIRRIGLTCLVRLEDYGSGLILPHERVLARPREDRLNLIRATRANLDSVFGLHNGKGVQAILQRITAGEKPTAQATDTAGITCRMWKASDPALVDELATRLNDEPILIADGHHRYDSALTYRNEMRAKTGSVDPNAPYEFVMMTVVSFEDKGLTILPTHRFVRGVVDEKALLDRLGDSFDATEYAADDLAQAVATKHDAGAVFGLYLGGGKAYMLRLKDSVDPTALDIPGSDALKRLDVTVLHSMILDGILGIDTRTPEGQAIVAYTRDDSEAITRVDSREFRLSFMMNAMRVEEVREVAAAGDIMPQKSTFFYPKLLTGMVMRTM